MIQNKNRMKEKNHESGSDEELLKEFYHKLNKNTYTFFKLKAIVRKSSVIKEISNTLDQTANENFDDLMDILN